MKHIETAWDLMRSCFLAGASALWMAVGKATMAKIDLLGTAEARELAAAIDREISEFAQEVEAHNSGRLQ
jgi:hypothetical protein